ncbi:tripartite motif-containing protein 16-like [Solea solea]|uniref:tripartite motif-containing protein 16-like n=1 Tax=Solea solea TaxID=90069 RepID=UPI00272C3B84|nr:tripartite motif-containing protein 16-like [Solea solea]
MAQTRYQMERNRLCCSICLDLLKNPVTVSCGHNYCMDCINNHWERDDERRIYSCPLCRETFRWRPILMKNTMLAYLVEELKKTQVHAAYQCSAGVEDVACDFCTDRKCKALKSCLDCLASYCEEHLQPHHQSPALKKHKLVEPSNDLQNICPRHNKVMNMFCRTDQQCICCLCSVEEHKDHDTVLAAVERTQRQRELDLSLEEVQQRLQDRDKDEKVLDQEVNALNLSADKAEKDTDKIFTEMMNLLQKRLSKMKQHIRSQQETQVSRVKDVQKKLQQEITELKKREAELKKLSLTHNHTQFLLNSRSVSALHPSTHSSTINIQPPTYFEEVTAAVAKIRGQLQYVLTETWTNIYKHFLTETEPKTRAEFLRYSQELTLDPNTVNTKLFLSGGNRKVTFTMEDQSYPRHTDRFTDFRQVLSKESLTGRCYWEVEWTVLGVGVAVTYKNISRSGDSRECKFGFNDKSWVLDCSSYSCEFYHEGIKTRVPDGSSSIVGVYLDHRAGLLSFYRVSDTMTLLHRVQTTFTQPLYAGVKIHYYGDTAEFCKLK